MSLSSKTSIKSKSSTSTSNVVAKEKDTPQSATLTLSPSIELNSYTYYIQKIKKGLQEKSSFLNSRLNQKFTLSNQQHIQNIHKGILTSFDDFGKLFSSLETRQQELITAYEEQARSFKDIHLKLSESVTIIEQQDKIIANYKQQIEVTKSKIEAGKQIKEDNIMKITTSIISEIKKSFPSSSSSSSNTLSSTPILDSLYITNKNPDFSLENLKPFILNLIQEDNNIILSDYILIKKGLIIIKASSESIKNIQEHLQNNTELATNLTISATNKKSKKLVIFNVPHDLTEEDLRRNIIKQLPTYSVLIEHVFFKTIRNGQRLSIVTLDHLSAELLLSRKLILINLNRFKIANHRNIIRCFKCQKFGHPSKYCKNAEICGKCCGHHSSNSCSSDVVKCANCGGPHASDSSMCPTFLLLKKSKVTSG